MSCVLNMIQSYRPLCATFVSRRCTEKAEQQIYQSLGPAPGYHTVFMFSDDLYRWVFYYFYHFCHLRWCSIFPLVNPPLWEDFFQVLQQIQVFCFFVYAQKTEPLTMQVFSQDHQQTPHLRAKTFDPPHGIHSKGLVIPGPGRPGNPRSETQLLPW